MAARRLIFVLLVLFAISVVAAALAPDRGGLFSSSSTTSSSTTTTETTATTTTDDATAPSRRARLEASQSKPPTVRAVLDEQLELIVASDRFRDLAIERLGLTGFAQPEAPARFDLLLRDPGSYPITDATSGTKVAEIQVAPKDKGRGDGDSDS